MADQAVIAQRSPYMMEGRAWSIGVDADGPGHSHSATALIRERSFPRSKWSSKNDSGSHCVAASTRRSRPFVTELIHASKTQQGIASLVSVAEPPPPELGGQLLTWKSRNSLREFTEKLDTTGDEQ